MAETAGRDGGIPPEPAAGIGAADQPRGADVAGVVTEIARRRWEGTFRRRMAHVARAAQAGIIAVHAAPGIEVETRRAAQWPGWSLRSSDSPTPSPSTGLNGWRSRPTARRWFCAGPTSRGEALVLRRRVPAVCRSGECAGSLTRSRDRWRNRGREVSEAMRGVGLLVRRIRQWLRSIIDTMAGWWKAKRAPGKFLCDSCRYDYGDACRRPERPNATRCPDYRPR
jgi:hypothetical protein